MPPVTGSPYGMTPRSDARSLRNQNFAATTMLPVCPHCRSQRTRRSHQPLGLGERLLACIYSPFRCTDCYQRFFRIRLPLAAKHRRSGRLVLNAAKDRGRELFAELVDLTVNSGRCAKFLALRRFCDTLTGTRTTNARGSHTQYGLKQGGWLLSIPAALSLLYNRQRDQGDSDPRQPGDTAPGDASRRGAKAPGTQQLH